MAMAELRRHVARMRRRRTVARRRLQPAICSCISHFARRLAAHAEAMAEELSATLWCLFRRAPMICPAALVSAKP